MLLIYRCHPILGGYLAEIVGGSWPYEVWAECPLMAAYECLRIEREGNQ